jgi:acetyl esterase
MVSGRRLLRRVLAVAALLWAAFGLFLALWIVLPATVLSWAISLLATEPIPTVLSWVISLLATEFSLLLAAYALLGIALAALARRARFRRTSLVAAVLGVVTVVLCLVPVVQGWRTASEEGVALSLSEYFSLPSIGSPETVTYARPGEAGEKLKLDVRRPPEEGNKAGPERRPAVVVVHGDAWGRGSRELDVLWPEWLSEQGYVVFSIDYRLAPPPRWQDAPGDVKCAVGWVKENAESYGVDPDRIALMGKSAGGHLSLLAAYTEGNPRLPPSCETGDTSVAAVVGFYGPTDLTRLCPDGDCESGESPVRTFTGATPATNPDRYRLVSPISHVDSSDPPTFLVQGGRDSITPPGQSPLLARRLEEAGVEHRLLELPWAEHGFDIAWGGWGSQITRPELERFLEQHLGRQSPKTQ